MTVQAQVKCWAVAQTLVASRPLPNRRRSLRSPDRRSGDQGHPALGAGGKESVMVEHHERPRWMVTAGRLIGLLAQLAKLIEIVRRVL